MGKLNRGFSMVELLVVILVMGILAATGVYTFSNVQAKGRDTQRKNDLKEIATALQLYYQDKGVYPAPAGWVHSGQSQPWIPGLDANYIKQLPVDPKNTTACSNPEGSTTCFLYRYSATTQGSCSISPLGSGYILEARMENSSDQDKAVTQAVPCNSGSYDPITGVNKGIYVRTNP